VDAAYDPDTGTDGMGAIARDLSGKFIAASCKKLQFLTDVVMVEAYALRDGLS
jgi:hypothetical protein